MKRKQNTTAILLLGMCFGTLSLVVPSSLFAWTNVEDGLTYAKQGKVIDAQTGKPIAGAWVVAKWLHGGYTYVEGSSHGGCRYSVTVQTDQDGTYLIPDVSKQVEVERSWSLLSQDAYKWSVMAYAPGHFRGSDFNPSVLSDAINGPEPLKALRSPALFTASNAEHPAVAGVDAGIKRQRLADIALESRPLPAPLEVLYLNDVSERSRCTSTQGKTIAQTLYREAYRIACTNNPSFAGAQFGLSNLWSAAAAPKDRTPAREEGLRKVGDKAYYNNHEYTTEDRKVLCELTQPDADGAK